MTTKLVKINTVIFCLLLSVLKAEPYDPLPAAKTNYENTRYVANLQLETIVEIQQIKELLRSYSELVRKIYKGDAEKQVKPVVTGTWLMNFCLTVFPKDIGNFFAGYLSGNPDRFKKLGEAFDKISMYTDRLIELETRHEVITNTLHNLQTAYKAKKQLQASSS